jgi:hypothetical protein
MATLKALFERLAPRKATKPEAQEARPRWTAREAERFVTEMRWA